jgi:hypothetical protein
MRQAGLRICVDDELRRDFIAACKAEDTTAAQVLRACMRGYVQVHGTGEREFPRSKSDGRHQRRTDAPRI